jgi:hypothetical protein
MKRRKNEKGSVDGSVIEGKNARRCFRKRKKKQRF